MTTATPQVEVSAFSREQYTPPPPKEPEPARPKWRILLEALGYPTLVAALTLAIAVPVRQGAERLIPVAQFAPTREDHAEIASLDSLSGWKSEQQRLDVNAFAGGTITLGLQGRLIRDSTLDAVAFLPVAITRERPVVLRSPSTSISGTSSRLYHYKVRNGSWFSVLAISADTDADSLARRLDSVSTIPFAVDVALNIPRSSGKRLLAVPAGSVPTSTRLRLVRDAAPRRPDTLQARNRERTALVPLFVAPEFGAQAREALVLSELGVVWDFSSSVTSYRAGTPFVFLLSLLLAVLIVRRLRLFVDGSAPTTSTQNATSEPSSASSSSDAGSSADDPRRLRRVVEKLAPLPVRYLLYGAALALLVYSLVVVNPAEGSGPPAAPQARILSLLGNLRLQFFPSADRDSLGVWVDMLPMSARRDSVDVDVVLTGQRAMIDSARLVTTGIGARIVSNDLLSGIGSRVTIRLKPHRVRQADLTILGRTAGGVRDSLFQADNTKLTTGELTRVSLDLRGLHDSQIWFWHQVLHRFPLEETSYRVPFVFNQVSLVSGVVLTPVRDRELNGHAVGNQFALPALTPAAAGPDARNQLRANDTLAVTLTIKRTKFQIWSLILGPLALAVVFGIPIGWVATRKESTAWRFFTQGIGVVSFPGVYYGAVRAAYPEVPSILKAATVFDLALLLGVIVFGVLAVLATSWFPAPARSRK